METPQILYVAGDTSEYKQMHLVHLVVRGDDGMNRADTRYFRDADDAELFIKSARRKIH